MAEQTLPSDFPMAGGELESLHGALERTRSTFAWKCGGLDAHAMQTTLGPSSLTLAGLLKHMAFVEDDTFTRTLLGRGLPSAWDRADGDGFSWAWRQGADDSAQELMALWREAVDRSRSAVVETLDGGGLDQLAAREQWGAPVNLRRLLVDMNEEYARHTGHAELIRESIDGLVGEDPPP